MVASPQMHLAFWISHSRSDTRGKEEPQRQRADSPQEHHNHDDAAPKIANIVSAAAQIEGNASSPVAQPAPNGVIGTVEALVTIG